MLCMHSRRVRRYRVGIHGSQQTWFDTPSCIRRSSSDTACLDSAVRFGMGMSPIWASARVMTKSRRSPCFLPAGVVQYTAPPHSQTHHSQTHPRSRRSRHWRCHRSQLLTPPKNPWCSIKRTTPCFPRIALNSRHAPSKSDSTLKSASPRRLQSPTWQFDSSIGSREEHRSTLSPGSPIRDQMPAVSVSHAGL